MHTVRTTVWSALCSQSDNAACMYRELSMTYFYRCQFFSHIEFIHLISKTGIPMPEKYDIEIRKKNIYMFIK